MMAMTIMMTTMRQIKNAGTKEYAFRCKLAIDSRDHHSLCDTHTWIAIREEK